MSGIEAPEKGPAGRERWKAAEELWREDGNAPGSGRAEKECAIFGEDLFPLLFKGIIYLTPCLSIRQNRGDRPGSQDGVSLLYVASLPFSSG